MALLKQDGEEIEAAWDLYAEVLAHGLGMFCLATPLLRCCAPFGAPRRRDLLLPHRLGHSAQRCDARCRMRADGAPVDDGGARETSLLEAASGAVARSAEERVTPQERCYE
jgi:hypothetical protein